MQSGFRTIGRILLTWMLVSLGGLSAWAEDAPTAPAEDAPTASAKETPPPADLSDITMKAHLSPREVYPGDPITLTVTFSAARPFAADVAGGLKLGDFELVERTRQSAEEDGRHIVTHRFVLTHFKAGQQDLEPQRFVVRRASADEERKTDRMRVTVKSLLQEEARKLALQQARDQQAGSGTPNPQAAAPGGAKIVDPSQQAPAMTLNVPGQAGGQPGQPGASGQPRSGVAGQPAGAPEPQGVKLAPRDIKGPETRIYKDYTLLIVLGVLLGLIVAGLLVWFILRRLQNREVVIHEAVIVDDRPAHVIALEAFRLLESEKLVAKRRIKDYHQRISEILRGYFARRYNLRDALSMTSGEIAGELKKLYLRDLDEHVVAELLYTCDLVLFAKDEPQDVACFERLETARLIVERTREGETTSGVKAG